MKGMVDPRNEPTPLGHLFLQTTFVSPCRYHNPNQRLALKLSHLIGSLLQQRLATPLTCHKVTWSRSPLGRQRSPSPSVRRRSVSPSLRRRSPSPKRPRRSTSRDRTRRSDSPRDASPVARNGKSRSRSRSPYADKDD
ncbi:hypothetical protein DPMN_008540 [Dreissena polymorpha]|uniref:Uncharacterized protein n=1 Tax=Dreissena polymorpha TaxID=45954 RepID=A0A9D4MVB5_DREPO|nr:hypothetical protein DPMN_008540 [Dreissena polymorpha]